MEALAQECLRLRERVTEVEHGNAVADDFERIGLVLGGGAGETVQAFCALKDLQGLQAVAAFASLSGIQTRNPDFHFDTLRANGIQRLTRLRALSEHLEHWGTPIGPRLAPSNCHASGSATAYFS